MSEPPQLFGKPRPEPQPGPRPGFPLEPRAKPQPKPQKERSPPGPQADPQFDPLVDPQLALSQQESRPESRLTPPQSGPQPQHQPQPQPQPQQESGEVLPEFPKKRRGRPPGRPNTTVREADYQSNPSVRLWNAAKIERPIPAVAINIREALTEAALVHDTQRDIFKLPSREFIHFVNGWITARHIASQRPSYVNGLLIHSRGGDSRVSCTQCIERRAKTALGPFLTCRVLPGSFHDSCSNCKWFDNTSVCSLYTGPKPNRKRKAKDVVMLDDGAPATETPKSTSIGEANADGNAQQQAADSQQMDVEDQPADADGEQAIAYSQHMDAEDQQAHDNPQQAKADPDSYTVDAQLAAQLLPHINKSE